MRKERAIANDLSALPCQATWGKHCYPQFWSELFVVIPWSHIVQVFFLNFLPPDLLSQRLAPVLSDQKLLISFAYGGSKTESVLLWVIWRSQSNVQILWFWHQRKQCRNKSKKNRYVYHKQRSEGEQGCIFGKKEQMFYMFSYSGSLVLCCFKLVLKCLGTTWRAAIIVGFSKSSS